MRRLCGLGAVLVVLGAALAPAASAKIVVGQGIAGVKLGDTQARVRHLLGKPDDVQAPDRQGHSTWGYQRGLMGRVSFDKKRHVDGIWTGSKKQKTSKGITVGSSLARLKAAYPKIKRSVGPFGPNSLICVLKSRFHRRTVETSFPFFTAALGVREVDVDLF